MAGLSEGVYRIVNVGTGRVLALDSADQVTVVGEPGVEDGWQHWLLSTAPGFGEEVWYIVSGRTGTRLGLGAGLVSAGVQVECSGPPMGWRIMTDEADPDRYRIAVWPPCELVLDLPGDGGDTGTDRIGLARYEPSSSSQRWHFQRA